VHSFGDQKVRDCKQLDLENVGIVTMRSDIAILLLITTLFVLSAIGFVFFYFYGKRQGISQEKERSLLMRENFDKKVRHIKSKNKGLQEEINSLEKKAEQYLYFIVRLPEAIKQINSDLSFEGLISAIMRLTKDLTGTEVIEIYMFNRAYDRLNLVAAYGTKREKSVEIMLDEGLIGKAASLKTIVSRGHPGINVSESEETEIDTVAPVVFSDSLLGALAVGKMKEATGSEKRFLAMLADLMAVALRNIRKLKIANEEAIKDSLTGLYNKKYFLEKAREALHSSTSYGFSVSIFIFDIDHFKSYNDRNGHVQGDILLKEMGRLLRENMRSTTIVARYGGEEFIILLQNTGNHAAMRFSDNIRKLIEAHPFPYREEQPLGCISISGGVATFPFDGSTVEEIITRADWALYAAKASGRNHIMQYEAQLLS
jgi:diguanylate cyclase (GGDEF)-like protein